MKFSTFIEANVDAIVADWEAFARTLVPAATSMSNLALRSHSREILLAVVHDMETSQTDAEQTTKATQAEIMPLATRSIAAAHGALRHEAGFNIEQLVSEFRAMRASVLALWRRSETTRGEVLAIEEIARFNEAIDQALGESVQRYSAAVAASKDLFLAILGHDLRSPLQGIELASQLLASAALPDDTRLRVAARVKQASQAMGRLITDLLEFTRTRLGGVIPVERRACDVGQVCDEALDAARASDPGQKFELLRSGNLLLQGDRRRLLQVLSNLLNNAVQHGDTSAAISLSAHGEEEGVVLRVANLGTPIHPDFLARIFEPLVQVQAANADFSGRSGTSLGLGLFVAREIVLGHDGTIEVESSADTGTVFTIRLPREVAAQPVEPA